MSMTKKQVEIVDALQNGAHIWQAANTYYLARVTGENHNGQNTYKSEHLPKKTFDALRAKGLLENFLAEPKKWRLKL